MGSRSTGPALAERLLDSAGRLADELRASGGVSPLAAVTSARDLARTVEETVRTTVEDARNAGHTWQEIGDVLGTTRQAAFQRFGRPVDPRTGQPMAARMLPGATAHAVGVLDELTRCHWDAARRHFDDTLLAALDADRLAAVWAQVVGLVGAYQYLGEPFAHQAGDYTVVDVPLYFEAGEMTARLSYDPGGRIAGLYLRAPGTL